MIKQVKVDLDEALMAACRPFDYAFDGVSEFKVPTFDGPIRDESWSIGLIIGPSGSGKTSLLKNHYGVTPDFTWNGSKAIASQVDFNKLMAVGLNSVPTWCRPYHVLSNGEAFRANMAATLSSNTSFDEFTSVVDRTVAKSCCHALQRYIRKENMTGVVFSSCHYDIVEWLRPDWVFDIQKGKVAHQGFFQRRPPIKLSIQRCDASVWSIFGRHHYLNTRMNKSAKCFCAYWGDALVGFSSALAFPNGNFKNAFREHRTVVLPDYQGIGIGVRLSDFIAHWFVSNGCRFFSKTAHPRMGEYREKSSSWRPTSKNKKVRKDYLNDRKTKESAYKHLHASRVCYSHEYVIEK